MQTRFHARLDDLLAELSRREPSYFARFGVSMPDIERAVAGTSDIPLFESVSKAEITAALHAGTDHLRQRGVAITSGEDDPLGVVLAAGILDSYAAEQGLLALSLPGCPARALAQTLRSDYEEKQADGIRYFVRRREGPPLVLVNACGIPHEVWSRFLADRDHDFRILIVERRGQDLLDGGIRQPCNLKSDAADILAALEHEGAGPADLLAWCDGGKLAIEVIRSSPGRFRKLILVSASLRGGRAQEEPRTAYESNFQKVIATLAQRPSLAPMFAKMLGEQLVSTDWDGLAEDAGARAAALLRLPAREHGGAVRVPMSRELFLLNHAKRIESDAAYPIDEGIAALDLPFLLVTGDYDHIANNTIACAALAQAPQRGTHAQISGAGHYCFDLQYPYFKLLARAFLIDGSRPPPTARLSVEEL